jgi:hypothetical protein
MKIQQTNKREAERLRGLCQKALPTILSGRIRAMAERIGDFLVRTKAMQQSQVETVLRAQKDGDKRSFGEIAVVLGFVTQAALDTYRAS